jgi:hypothetical protein
MLVQVQALMSLAHTRARIETILQWCRGSRWAVAD